MSYQKQAEMILALAGNGVEPENMAHEIARRHDFTESDWIAAALWVASVAISKAKHELQAMEKGE